MKKLVYFIVNLFLMVCIRSVDGYETIEEARLHALTLRKQLYDSTYNSLIENEIAQQSLSSSTAGESDSGICDKS